MVTQLKGSPTLGGIVALGGVFNGLGTAGSDIKNDFMARGIEPINLVTYSGRLDGNSVGPCLPTDDGTGTVTGFGQYDGRSLYNAAYCADSCLIIRSAQHL